MELKELPKCTECLTWTVPVGDDPLIRQCAAGRGVFSKKITISCPSHDHPCTMTSILAIQPHTFPKNSLIIPMDKVDMAQNHDSSLQRRPKTEGEGKDRGRRRSRPNNKSKDSSGDISPVGGTETVEGHSSGTDGPSRKRRRSRKGLDKKFECPQEGCGKSYSRAEHLLVSQTISYTVNTY